MSTTRLVLIGPMTGRPRFNYPAFEDAANALRAHGAVVVSPHENEPPRCGTWAGWMRASLAGLVTCTHGVLLDGWKDSKGALLEVRVAKALGMELLTLREALERARHADQLRTRRVGTSSR